jgi:hypothetical protein
MNRKNDKSRFRVIFDKNPEFDLFEVGTKSGSPITAPTAHDGNYAAAMMQVNREHKTPHEKQRSSQCL